MKGITLLVVILAFAGGWFLKEKTDNVQKTAAELSTLRLNSYTFTKPLLTCDIPLETESIKTKAIREKVLNSINVHKQQGDVTTVSVYFRDFNNNEYFTINPDDKFYPASLNKIPVMIAAFKEAETNPGLLSQKYSLNDIKDQNDQQEILPKDPVKIGQEYTIEEAIEKMIMYSDNNAFYLLAQHINPTIYKNTFNDLSIPMREDSNNPPDYVGVEKYSNFLRVLYNATYLTRDYSEKAMQILSQVDFKDGLVVGVPNTVTIAHKYGHQGIIGGNSISRELHDCGIVFLDKGDYLLCVMTKSTSSLENTESTIKEISNTIYNEMAAR